MSKWRVINLNDVLWETLPNKIKKLEKANVILIHSISSFLLLFFVNTMMKWTIINQTDKAITAEKDENVNYCSSIFTFLKEQMDHFDSLCRYSSGERPPSSHHSSHLPKLLSKASRGLEKPLIFCSITEESNKSTCTHTLQVLHTCRVGDPLRPE